MISSTTDLATALLEQHVKHELAHFKGAKFRKYLEQEVSELFAFAARVPLARVCSPDQVKGVIRRLVVGVELPASVAELVGEMTHAVLGAPEQSNTLLKDIVSEDQITVLLDELLEMKHHREQMISGVMSHPVYQELVSGVVYQGLVNYLYEDNLITKTVPGVGSMMKFGKKMANKAMPGLDESFERRIKDWLSGSLPGLISRSESFLHKALTDEEIRGTVMELWDSAQEQSVTDIREALGEVRTDDFVELGFEFWLNFRQTAYFQNSADAVVDKLFEQYGDRPLKDLMDTFGVDQTLVMTEVEAIGLPLMDVLREEGYLEEAVRRRLSGFYRSAAVKKLLDHES